MQGTESTTVPRSVRREPPSLGSALERTYEAGQQYVSDRLELSLLELRQQARRATLVAAGAALALLGWGAAMGAFVLWQGAPLALEHRLLLVGLAHLLLGGAVAGAGLRRPPGERGDGIDAPGSPGRGPEPRP